MIKAYGNLIFDPFQAKVRRECISAEQSKKNTDDSNAEEAECQGNETDNDNKDNCSGRWRNNV